MLGAIGGLAGGIGSLVGAVSGISQGAAASRAQSDANNVALLNWLENRRNSDFQRELATAGQINARGDRTGYIPGVGFVATPSAFTQGMQNLADAEDVAGYTVDQPRAREEARAAFLRRLAASSDADAARAGRSVGQRSLPAVEGAMIERGFAEADSGADNLRGAIGVNAVRTGSGGEVAVANAARGALANRRAALARAREAAPSTFTSMRGEQNTVAENAIASPMRRASGQTTARLAGGEFDALNRNGSAAAELASRFLQRGGQVEAPRLGYADDRTGVGIAGFGRAAENMLTQLGRARKSFDAWRGNGQASEMEGVF